jgi:hypothetical protein
LERDAKRNGRSLSHEIEIRLADSVRAAATTDERTRALNYLINEMAKILTVAERKSGAGEFNWRADRFDFEAFKSAIVQLLDRMAPTDEMRDSRYLDFQTPEEAGRVAMHTVIALLARNAAVSHAWGDALGRASDSYFYAMPQAARALNFNVATGGKS